MNFEFYFGLDLRQLKSPTRVSNSSTSKFTELAKTGIQRKNEEITWTYCL